MYDVMIFWTVITVLSVVLQFLLRAYGVIEQNGGF
jgi:hypothetical protein